MTDEFIVIQAGHPWPIAALPTSLQFPFAQRRKGTINIKHSSLQHKMLASCAVVKKIFLPPSKESKMKVKQIAF